MKILLLFILLVSLYKNIDPQSVSQNLAFYELYPDTLDGKEALKRALSLLGAKDSNLSSLPKTDPATIISLINKGNNSVPNIKNEDLNFIKDLASSLPNRKLKGNSVLDEMSVLALPPSEIDLARSIFIAEGMDFSKIELYESIIDLMALQIRARLTPNSSPEEKINAINNFIFSEMRFRFPPHSLYAENVDLYTFLPSVIDSRRGVCLGVSVLYLSLAQRVGLDLEIVTPPGHIYLKRKQINIETTARGINLPTSTYLSIETRKSQLRNIKEVVAMVLMNKAALYWGKEEFSKALKLYIQAKAYIPNDTLLKEFYAYNLLFTGDEEKAIKIFEEIKDFIPDFSVSKETIPEDFLNKKTDAEGIKAVFMEVDEKRESILKKQERLKKTLKKYPQFRAGLLQLASTYLQLGREKEAIKLLKEYSAIDPKNPTVNYYLAALFFDRFDYKESWNYLKKAENITKSRDHYPKVLKTLERDLNKSCPQP